MSGVINPPAKLTKELDDGVEHSIVSAGLITKVHGFGVEPKLIKVELLCKVAENGYSIGDKINYTPVLTNQNAFSYGLTISFDDTNIYGRFGSQSTPILWANGSTGVATVVFTNANWKFIIKGWA